jgi:hypothetical protein
MPNAFATFKDQPTVEVGSMDRRAINARVVAVARSTGVPIDIVRTFAKISDPANANRFDAKAAHTAFGHLRPSL